MAYTIAIDQGTTGTTAVLIDSENFKFIDQVNMEFKQIYPRPSWVEHDLNDIWSTVEKTILAVIDKTKIKAQDIDAIGITNQRETTCAFSRDGVPLANAIVWQDRRTSSRCEEIKKSPLSQSIIDKTGLPIDPYFSATKMEWLLNNNTQVKEAAKNKDLLFGTIDTFLLYRLTAGKSYFTEASNASRTLLMDIHTGKWDDEILDYLEINKSFLPEIKDSFTYFGETKGLTFLPDGIPISGVLGDQQAALFGQACFNKGDMKCTYGTGAFMLLNTGETAVTSKTGLLTTIAYQQSGKITYALEGSSFIAGAAVGWLRDNLNILESSSEVEVLAKKITDLVEMEYLQFFPYFNGIGSPHWRPQAKAAILGITRDTNKYHISRACLEGITLAVNDVINSMRKDSNLEIAQLKVDGGAVANNLLMEMQASFSSLDILRPEIIETTAFGAALAANVGLNKLKIEDAKHFWNLEKKISPGPKNSDYYKSKEKLWSETVQNKFL